MHAAKSPVRFYLFPIHPCEVFMNTSICARIGLSLCLVVGGALTIGCTQASESSSTEEGDLGTAEQAYNGAGQTCTGSCYAYQGYVRGEISCGSGTKVWVFSRPNVTQDCRDRVVEYCHSYNLGFRDAAWTYSPPSNGYICLYSS